MTNRCSAMRMLCVVIFAVLFIPLVCSAAISGRVTRTDGNPERGARITYTDESNPDIVFTAVTDDDGRYEIMTVTSVRNADNSTVTPEGFLLDQNYPNPFNPATVIPFSLERAGFVRLELYNMLGQRIRTLISGYYSKGRHSASWNGVDDNGMSAAAGVYIYQLKQGQNVQSRKMLLIDGGNQLLSAGISQLPTPLKSTDIEPESASNTPGFLAKTTGNNTYRVSITGQLVFPFDLNGVTVNDGDVLDFVISTFSGSGSSTWPSEQERTVELSMDRMIINVIFPANVFYKDVTLTIKHAHELAPALDFPLLNSASDIWSIDAEFKEYDYHSPGPELLKTSLLSIPYDLAGLGGEIPEKDLFAAYWNGNSWIKLNGVLDREKENITVETRLGLWSVFYGRLIGDITVGQSIGLMEDNATNENFVVLDVRSSGEYESGYIENAINIDYRSETFRDEVNKLDKSNKYLVYCLAGARSSGAAGIMDELGFIEVYNMLGGIRQWLFENHPVVE